MFLALFGPLFVHLPRTNSCTPRTRTLLLLFHVRAVPLPPLQVVLEQVLFVVQVVVQVVQVLKVFPLVPQVVVAAVLELVLFVVRGLLLKVWPLVLVVQAVEEVSEFYSAVEGGNISEIREEAMGLLRLAQHWPDNADVRLTVQKVIKDINKVFPTEESFNEAFDKWKAAKVK